jgi:hypothetical protein
VTRVIKDLCVGIDESLSEGASYGLRIRLMRSHELLARLFLESPRNGAVEEANHVASKFFGVVEEDVVARVVKLEQLRSARLEVFVLADEFFCSVAAQEVAITVAVSDGEVDVWVSKSVFVEHGMRVVAKVPSAHTNDAIDTALPLHHCRKHTASSCLSLG